MDKEKEVKPCPFCGGKVWHYRNSFKCVKCGYTIIFDNLKYYQADTFPRRHNLVLEAWNTRAERTCRAESHDCGDGVTGLYCSECGNYIDENDNYCPNCGAKVVGE